VGEVKGRAGKRKSQCFRLFLERGHLCQDFRWRGYVIEPGALNRSRCQNSGIEDSAENQACAFFPAPPDELVFGFPIEQGQASCKQDGVQVGLIQKVETHPGFIHAEAEGADLSLVFQPLQPVEPGRQQVLHMCFV
jgi:hypothetical protein